MTEGGDGQLLRVLKVIHRIEDGILSLVLGAMVFLAAGQILLRNLLEGSAGWVDPLLRVMVLWLGLLGAVVASRSDKHIAIDLIPRTLPGPARCTVRALTCLFTSSVCVLLTYHAARFVVSDREAATVAFASVPTWILELILPAAFAVIALRYLLRALLHVHTLLRRGGVGGCD